MNLNANQKTFGNPPVETHGFVFNHTMLRVKDIDVSLDFYTRILGFQLINQQDFPEDGFSLYFLAYLPKEAQIPIDPVQRRHWQAGLSGLLELTHNYGTESTLGPVYHHGNSEPRGFGHICISVPDLAAACSHFTELGVPFKKRLEEGRMKTLAFITDPDGYWIEIISNSFKDEIESID